MFGSSDVGAKRDVMGAIMFYVAQLIALAGLSTVLVHFLGMAGVVENAGNFFDGGHTFTLIGTIFTLWLGGSILTARKATSDTMSILIVATGVYLAWTSGIMLGLIPIALLTTVGKE
ncbi:MAG: hypothetical protein HY370_00395 [Proteobacteria bacterium]|nr:hypothetical protein [Pseudomonadota bacterium]